MKKIFLLYFVLVSGWVLAGPMRTGAEVTSASGIFMELNSALRCRNTFLQKPVNSKVEQVTVFLNGAQVTRSASTPLITGTTQLLFGGLPANINAQSIQVKGEGNFTVLSVVHQLNYLNEQTKAKTLTDLEARQRALRDRLESENNMVAVYQQEEQVLMENKRIGGQQQGVKVSELKEAADFYRTRLAEIKTKQLAVTHTIRDLNEEIEQINRQLQELRAKQDQPTGEILVTVSSKVSTTANFTLSYLVNEAGWRPTYDIRVKDVSNPILLVYKANVFQTSGEDWQNVKLTLSTGNPSQSGSQPVLSPWYLGFYRPNPTRLRGMASLGPYNSNVRQISGRVTGEDGNGIPGVTVLIKGTAIGTATNAEGHYSLQVPVGASQVVYSFVGYVTQEMPVSSPVMNIALTPDVQSLQEVVTIGYGALQGRAPGVEVKDAKREEAAAAVATQEIRQTSVDFTIDLPYSIPSDGKQYAVDMQEYNIPAYYEYYCAPKLDPDAFLLARITNWEEYNLLEGEANLFFEGTFLGKSLLDVRNMGDTLNLSLGRDPNVVVTRTKLKDFSSNQLIGANRRETRAWEINIRNKKNQPINLVVEDQFPVSTNKDIEIDRPETSGATLDETTGKLTWKFPLAAAQSRKLNAKYTVKYPKHEKIVLE